MEKDQMLFLKIHGARGSIPATGKNEIILPANKDVDIGYPMFVTKQRKD
jgi:hypothetical protein